MSLPINNITHAIIALAIVLGIVFLAARVVRSVGPTRMGFAPRSASRLVLLETLAIDRTRAVHLVQFDGRDLLLLTGPTGQNRIDRGCCIKDGQLEHRIAGEAA